MLGFRQHDREHLMTVSTFRVAEMDCGAEEQLVRLKLATLDGVNRVSVDLESRQVTVEHELVPTVVDSALQELKLDTTHLDDSGEMGEVVEPARQRRALLIALLINAGFFVGELIVGLLSRSMGLVADALDMGADASVYALSLAAVAASTLRKKELARISAYLQGGLAVVGLFEVIRRTLSAVSLPDSKSMIIMSVLALIGNVVTLVVLKRVTSGEAHMQASWIFTANDIKVNGLVILAAVIVALTNSAIPDLVSGAFIFLIVANGARRILQLSK